jgi:class 3 adenylate cyclase
VDPELIALASTGATTIVALLATDAWGQAKSGLVSLWQHTHPDDARNIERELTEARTALLAARAAGDGQAAQVMISDWRDRLTSMLAAEPGLGSDLRRLLQDELHPALAQAAVSVVKTKGMRAKASGHGRIYQAGRDQHINE